MAKRVQAMTVLAVGLVLAAALALACSLPAWALDVRSQCVRDGRHVQLAGDTYAIARVADATVHHDGALTRVTYSTRPAFLEFDASWENLASSQLHDKAQQLARFVSQNDLYEQRAVSNAEGVASFPDVGEGLYLVVREAVAEGNEAYVCDAVLVGVPVIDEGNAVYEVSIAPKFSWLPPVLPQEPADADRPPASSEEDAPLSLIGGLVKTGSLVPGLLTLASAVAVGLFVVLAARARADKAGSREK